MNKKSFLVLLLIFGFLTLGATSIHAQGPTEDDTVRISNVVVDANSSVVVDVVLKSSRNLSAVTVPIVFTKENGDTMNIDCDSIHWSDWVWNNPSQPLDYTGKDTGVNYVDSTKKQIDVFIYWTGFDEVLLAGSGTLFSIYFTTHEFWGGGVAKLDTFINVLPPEKKLELVDWAYISWTPVFIPGSIGPTWVKEVETGNSGLPEKFALNQNYPNPFNPTTVMRFALPEDSWVKVEVFNILGQKITTLVDEYLSAGYKETGWDGTDSRGNDVASGIYFYKINARNFTDIKKMVLLK